MGDSGQPDKSPSWPPVPQWAPAPDDAESPKPPAETSSPTTPSPFGGDYAATMRLIPVPPPTTPPPPFGVPAGQPAGRTRRLPPAPPPPPPPPLLGPPAGQGAGDRPPPQVPGERYIGKYRVKGELGRGGMGTVYLAEQPGLGREVAIKELIQSADPVALKRFLQEAQVMARTSHPNLVQVHDMELQGNINYLVLEFIPGRSPRDWMNQSEIPPPQGFAVMHGVLQALDYAHRHAHAGAPKAAGGCPTGSHPRARAGDPQVALQATRGQIPERPRVRRRDVAGGRPDVPGMAASPGAGR